jgi:hypothetical protein
VDAALLRLRRSPLASASSIIRKVATWEARLLSDCQAGEVIPVPLSRRARSLSAKHAPLANLYCLDLPDFWRMLYTIVRMDGKRYCVVVELVDHPTYDQWFPGRKRH